MDQDTAGLPSYQQSIGYAMAYSTVAAACELLQVMHARGTLDLCERDEEGYNVIERFMERAPLCEPMLDTLDELNARAAYTQPHKGRWAAMDRQIQWARSLGGNNVNRHSDQGGFHKKPEAALARMIGQVNGNWFDVDGHDRGASHVARLVACPNSAPRALGACWARGIDPNVRKPDGSLAMSAMQDIPVFDEWIQAGGDVLGRAWEHKPYPIWQAWANRARAAHTGKDISAEIRGCLVGLVPEAQLHDACQFMAARHHSGNQSEMIKLLNTIDDWMHKQRYTGTPIWLDAVRARPLLLDNLLDRKRQQPDFKQRDAKGRSAWFAVLACQEDALFDKLQKVAPIQEMGRDRQGRGLLVQAVLKYGGLAGLGADTTGRVPLLHGCIKQMLRANAADRGCFLDAMEQFTPRHLDGMDQAEMGRVGMLLITQSMVAARMDNQTLAQLFGAVLHVFQDSLKSGGLSDDHAKQLELGLVDLVSRQCELPLEEWIGLAQNMEKGWNQKMISFAGGLLPILKAEHSRSAMDKGTHAPRPASPGRGARF